MTYIFILITTLYFQVQTAGSTATYRHILITNDDGIEDADRLLALAKSVSEIADRVSIVVSSFDRSGTSNHTTFGKYQSTLEVTCKYRDEENNIAAYETPGNPADCVLLGIAALFPDDRPDLVLSGINGGANIGVEWFGSGTIGAIRTAAFLGVPGIALSGFNSDDERSFTEIPRWVTDFLSSGVVEEMAANDYLTIGFPEIPLEDIKGVKIAGRRISLADAEAVSLRKILGDNPHAPKTTTVWTLGDIEMPSGLTRDYDDTFLHEGYIVITPMTIDENNAGLLDHFKKKEDQIPGFSVK